MSLAVVVPCAVALVGTASVPVLPRTGHGVGQRARSRHSQTKVPTRAVSQCGGDSGNPVHDREAFCQEEVIRPPAVSCR